MPRDLARPTLPLPSPPPLQAPADFEERLALLGVSLEKEKIAQLGDYLARLLAMNEQMSLTSITDPPEAWTRHALDALTLLPHLAELPKGASLLDVGSGGGVPGIVIAIARPDLRITLLDATEKKVAFLSAVAKVLGLDQVTAIAGRAEKLATTPIAGTFDAVTARALGKLQALLPWTVPFVKPGGRLLLIKGERAEEELEGARRALIRFRCTHDRTALTPTGRVVLLRVR